MQDCAWAELAKLLYQIVIVNLFMISHSEGLMPKKSDINGFSSWWAQMKENRFLQFLIRRPLLTNLKKEESLWRNADWKGKVLITIHYFLWMSGEKYTHLFFFWIIMRQLGKWFLIQTLFIFSIKIKGFPFDFFSEVIFFRMLQC